MVRTKSRILLVSAGVFMALSLFIFAMPHCLLAMKAPSAEDVLSFGAAEKSEPAATEAPAGKEQPETTQAPATKDAPATKGAPVAKDAPVAPAQVQEQPSPTSPPVTQQPSQPMQQEQTEEDSWEDESGPDAFGQPETEAGAIARAERAALRWLKMVDAGKFAASWDRTTRLFKLAVSREDWEHQLKAVRAPMGRLVKRKRANAQYTEYLAGAPDGVYVVFQFATTFARKSRGVETVTMQREEDGVWRIGGYFIR